MLAHAEAQHFIPQDALDRPVPTLLVPRRLNPTVFFGSLPPPLSRRSRARKPLSRRRNGVQGGKIVHVVESSRAASRSAPPVVDVAMIEMRLLVHSIAITTSPRHLP